MERSENPEITTLRAKAERGNAIAQYNLGLVHAEGRGTVADPVEAFVWLTLAAESGSTGKALESVLNTLSAEQLREGRARLENLRQNNQFLRAAAAAANAKKTNATALAAQKSGGITVPSARAASETPAELQPIPDETTRANPNGSEPAGTQANENRELSAELAASRDEISRLREELSRRVPVPSPAPRNDPAIAALQTQLKEAQTSLATQSAELAAKRVEAETTRTELARLQTAAAEARARIEEANTAHERLRAEANAKDAAEQALAAAQEEVRRLKVQNSELTARAGSADDATKRGDEFARDVSTWQAKATAIQAENERLREQLEQMNRNKVTETEHTRELAEVRAELGRTHEELAKSRSVADQATADLTRTREELAAAHHSTETTKNALAERDVLAHELQASQTATAKAETQLASVREQLQTLEAERRARQGQDTGNQEQITRLTTELEAARRDATAAMAKTGELSQAHQRELNILEQKLGERAADSDTLKAQIAALEKNRTEATLARDAVMRQSSGQQHAIQKEVQQLQSRLAIAEATTADRVQELEQVRRELAAANASSEKQTSAVATIAQLETEKHQLKVALEKATAQFNETMTERAAARTELDKLQVEIVSLREQASAAREMESRIRQLEQQKAALEVDQSSSTASARALGEAEEKLAISLRSYALVAAERDQLKARSGDLVAKLDATSAALEKAEREAKASAENARQVSSTELESSRQALAAVQQQLQAANAELHSLREQAGSRATAQDRVRQLETEKAALTERLNEAESAQRRDAEALVTQANRPTPAQREAEEKLQLALRSTAALTKERDELNARVTDLAAQLSQALPGATELDSLRSRASAAERRAELAQAEVARAHQLLATARTQPAPPVAVAAREVVRPTATPSAAARSAPAPAARSHTILAGETLSGISRQYYGTASRWPEILAANRDVIRDERSLVAGRKLRIP